VFFLFFCESSYRGTVFDYFITGNHFHKSRFLYIIQLFVREMMKAV